ncbi:MAG: hypothetical protein EXS33_07255 [Pedosphaera sp.]|nr:hypothetical protein [Pedosphaera sp.]
MALLINVFSVADIIHHEASVLQFKERAVITGAQAVLVLEALEFFDVPGQVVLARSSFVPIKRRASFGKARSWARADGTKSI